MFSPPLLFKEEKIGIITLKVVHFNCPLTGLFGSIGAFFTDTATTNIGTCFGAGTKVKMANGFMKNIEDINVGDKVLSYNFKTQQTEPDEVLELYSPMNDNMMEMKFSDGTIIRSTFDHPYYVKDKGWSSLKPDITKELITNITEISRLQEGDICYMFKDGELVGVEFVSSKRIPTFQRTYTIKKLKKNNSFFAEGVLVGVETVKHIEDKNSISYLKQTYLHLVLGWLTTNQPDLKSW